jgi:hypothetical protein
MVSKKENLMNELKMIINQLHPQVKRDTTELRMKIANRARYHANMPNTPYGVTWDGQHFVSDDTYELVTQVINWLKRPVEDRAKEILDR